MHSKKNLILLILLVLSALFLTNVTYAHDDPRIAMVNVTAIEQNSSAWQKKLAILQEQFKRNRDSILEREKALQAEVQEYEKQRPLLSQDQQQTRDAEINQKLAELQNTAGQVNATLDQQSTLANQNLRVKIAEIIEVLAKELTLDLILEVGAENFAVMFYTARLDITAEVIKRLNSSYPMIILE
ncbi:MAG: OmpH family outer membrane protein [Alphaproteobacteria bacterium]|nr:OmpH family outer membrane protein [Alphaproteobacteria bacterium]